jgi:hypothetical protein
LYVPGVQVSEERLISLLEKINNQTNKQTKVTVCKFMEQINIFALASVANFIEHTNIFALASVAFVS